MSSALIDIIGAAGMDLEVDVDAFIDGRRVVTGGSFILDAPDAVPAIWGDGDQVLAAAGEPTLIVGPAGVGKTTLVDQIAYGRLGLLDHVLGFPVVPGDRRLLYLACDRPQQIARAFGRLARPEHRQHLDERLVVWKGPPSADLAERPETLAELCRRADADTVIIDSLKDVAIGLSDDKVGAGLNNGIQRAIADGVEVIGLHHQRKGQDGKKPKTLADVYGSTWITAGAGSVILLWGEAGDLIVELSHLKQPAATVGPLKIEHDHATGLSSIFRGFDVLTYLRNRRTTTAIDTARQMFEKQTPSDNERKKAQRALDRLVAVGFAHRTDPVRGGEGGTQAATYRPAALSGEDDE